jgi:chloramphenicol 3-O-phosphotransferase
VSELRTAVLAAVATRIDALPRPAVVAVDGVTAAGKTTFADELVALMAPPVVRISLDDFHRPEAERHARGQGPESYYHDTFHLDGVEAARARYASRYVPGETLYLEAGDPATRADVVIDTTDPRWPRLI